MTLHVPAHHAGFAGDHRLLRDILFAVGLLVVLLAVLLVAPMIRIQVEPNAALAEQNALIEFRAGERLSWAQSLGEDASLIEFRASEREGR